MGTQTRNKKGVNTKIYGGQNKLDLSGNILKIT